MHAQGIAHGDVRPQQVRTQGDGSVKLTDTRTGTGLSRCGPATHRHRRCTSAAYQAPERWDNRPPSVGADLYALGVILYRMLAARVPFDGTSPLAIAMRHRRDTPLKPSQFNANCPRDLERIAMRLLEKDPQSRYVSAAHLLRDLSPASDDDNAAVANVPTLPRRRSRLPAVAAAAVAPAPVAAASVAPIFPAPQPSFAPAVSADTGNASADGKAPTGTPMYLMTRTSKSTPYRVARKKHRRREFWGAFGALIWMLIAAGCLGGLFYGRV